GAHSRRAIPATVSGAGRRIVLCRSQPIRAALSGRVVATSFSWTSTGCRDRGAQDARKLSAGYHDVVAGCGLQVAGWGSPRRVARRPPSTTHRAEGGRRRIHPQPSTPLLPRLGELAA